MTTTDYRLITFKGRKRVMLKKLLLTSGMTLALAASPFAYAADQMNTDQTTGAESETQSSATGGESGIIGEQRSDQVLVQDLIGMNAVNQQGESLGSVEDLVLDQEGKLTGIVLSTGGFLGLGAKPVGVAWSDLTAAVNADVLTLDLTAEQIAAAPDFKTKTEKDAERESQQQQQQQQQQMQQNNGTTGQIE